MDLEMTGINSWGNQVLDYPEERYQKCKTTSEKFRIISIGLCMFIRISDNEYLTKPYNFFVFPEENSGNNFVNCETSSLVFNRDHNMDFNKWIHKGIPYVNSVYDKKLIDGVMDGYLNLYNPDDKFQHKNTYLSRDDDKKKYEELKKKFDSFYADKNLMSMEFEKCQKYLLYHFFNQLPSEVRQRIWIDGDSKEEKSNVMNFFKIDPSEKKVMIESARITKLNLVNQRRGFRRIFERMLEKRSCLIGHNMMLDLLFLISHFGDPVPNSLKEFKSLLRICFSGVIDTKYIFEKYSEKLKIDLNEKSNLENVFVLLKEKSDNKLNFIFPESFENYNKGGSIHDSGFDAFITGSCYAYMKFLLGTSLIKDCTNKVFFMKSIYSCFDLQGEDPILNVNESIYCLKAKKNRNEIVLDDILDPSLMSKVKRVSNEYMSSIVIFADLPSFDLIISFENRLNQFKNLFEWMKVHQFKELINEETKRKNSKIHNNFNY